MNRDHLNAALWGLLILLVGIAALLYNFGALDDYKVYVIYALTAVLAIGGVAFLVPIAFQRERWPFALPGFSLLALAGDVYLAGIESVEPQWLGLIFLAGLALGFFVLFLSDRDGRWWGLLLAGVILTVGVVVLLLVQSLLRLAVDTPEPLTVAVPGAVMFGGFGLTFLLLYLFVDRRRTHQWALIMAGVMGVFAMALLAEGLGGGESVIVQLWPLLLVLAGAYLISRLFLARPAARPALPAIPAERLEEERAAASPAGEPARIVRPSQSGQSPARQSSPAPQSTPNPPPPPEAETPAPRRIEPETLPAELSDVDLSNPEAALDALLDASRKMGEEDR